MRTRIIAIGVVLLSSVVIGATLWWGDTNGETVSGNAPLTSVTAPAVSRAKVASTQAGAVSKILSPSVPALTVPAIASEAEREKTATERKAVLPVFLKAADESMAQLQREIALAKARGASATEITKQEEKLKRIQIVRQQVLARNSDVQP